MSRYREFCPNCAFGGCEDAEKIVQDPKLNAIRKGIFYALHYMLSVRLTVDIYL